MTHRDEPRPAPDDAPPAPTAEPDGPAGPPAGAGSDELAELKDRYLRLAAEYDNFRKRTSRERLEAWSRAQADVVGRLVDALDDLARFSRVDPDTTDAKTLHEGVDLVERKLWKALDALGVRRLDAVDVAFDPNEHEAVSREPALAPEQDHTIGGVLQAGYKLGELLIRPARVVVRTWDGEPGPAAAPATPESSDD